MKFGPVLVERTFQPHGLLFLPGEELFSQKISAFRDPSSTLDPTFHALTGHLVQTARNNGLYYDTGTLHLKAVTNGIKNLFHRAGVFSR